MNDLLRYVDRLERRIRLLESSQALYSAWDDQQVNISSAKLPASGAPTWTTYRGSEVLSFSASQTNTISFVVQFTHRYREGTDFEFHIHPTYTNADTGNVYWRFTHSFAAIGAAYPAETTVNIQVAASGTADQHELVEIAPTISGTGLGISSIGLCSLARIGGSDTHTGAVYLAATDFHIEVNSLGSRLETSK